MPAQMGSCERTQRWRLTLCASGSWRGQQLESKQHRQTQKLWGLRNENILKTPLSRQREAFLLLAQFDCA